MDVRRCSIFIAYISLEILYASSPTLLASNDIKTAVVRRGKYVSITSKFK